MSKIRFENFIFNACQTIKRIRKEKGFTQGLVAERMQVPQSMVARFESGKINDAHISVFFRICEAIEEDIAGVLTRAINTTIGELEPVGNDLNQRWDILRSKFSLLENQRQKELIVLFEGIFKVAQ